MAGPAITKAGHRVNMYFPAEMYEEMKEWVRKNNTNITELCRESIRYYLENMRRERKRRELVETCRLLSLNGNQDLRSWTGMNNE